MEKSAFWNISNSALCCNSVAQIWVLRSNESFEMLKSSENVNSNGLGRFKNENVFPKTTLGKGL